jgi:hypothetical protein
MSVDEFIKDPSRRSHPVYDASLFDMAAPEYSEGEDLLGSAYRGLLLGITDRDVDVDLIKQIPTRIDQAIGGGDLWVRLLNDAGGLASPRRKKKDAPELMPIIPTVGYYACVRGAAARRRWFPANLLLEVIGGGLGLHAGTAFVEKLRNALTIGSTDDLMAVFLDRAILPPPGVAAPTPITLHATRSKAYCPSTSSTELQSPAMQFCSDFEAIIALKDTLTRRQWTVLLEGMLRLGTAMHTLWVCQANSLCWQMILGVAGGEAVPSEQEIRRRVWSPRASGAGFLSLGVDAKPLIRQLLELYVYGRFGINLCLHRLEDTGYGWPQDEKSAIAHVATSPRTAAGALHHFLTHVATHRHRIDAVDAKLWLHKQLMSLCDSRLELLRSESGFTRNMWFFLRHGLGQIEPTDSDQKEYDQAYLLVKRGRTSGERWFVDPGPAMLIAIVHACCVSKGRLPASLEDLRVHFSQYGLHAPAGELVNGAVGTALERLGLVVDSPDAAGGRLLVKPF